MENKRSVGNGIERQTKDKIKVLVVDDEESVRKIISILLDKTEEYEIDTITVPSGMNIENDLEQHQPDLVILDRCFLPGDPMGDEVLERIYKTNNKSQVIMFSADVSLSFNEISKLEIPKRYIMNYVTILSKNHGYKRVQNLIVNYFSHLN